MGRVSKPVSARRAGAGDEPEGAWEEVGFGVPVPAITSASGSDVGFGLLLGSGVDVGEPVMLGDGLDVGIGDPVEGTVSVGAGVVVDGVPPRQMYGSDEL
jgi:hypothetical protein